MASSEYWTEKTISWNSVKVGFAILIFALVMMLLAENPVHLIAKAAKTADFDVRREETARSDSLTDKEYHLLNCLYCE